MAGRRFLIDGSMAKRGGGFTYLVNVLPELARQAPDDRFLAVVADERIADSLPSEPNVDVEYLGNLGARQRLAFTYRQAGRLAARWGADLYFSAGELVAAFRNPNVFARKRDYRVGARQTARFWALWGLARASARRADRVMFVSEDSARWIGDSIGLPRDKRAVIHHGIDLERWNPTGVATAGSHILSVSSVYPYKNYVRLIEAYAQLFNRCPDAPELVIIGDDQDPEYSAKMAAAREVSGEARQAIHILGEVPYAEIAGYYRDAAMFVFPSYLETFGHPLLEAMANDLPLVAADIPVFREIAQDAAVYADPYDPSALAGAMEAVLSSENARRGLVKRGRERLRSLTWRKSAGALLDLFQQVLGAPEPSRAPVPIRSRVSFPPAQGRPLQNPGVVVRARSSS
jgi:glycosyltransferase involved in cell wall biosynthesis